MFDSRKKFDFDPDAFQQTPRSPHHRLLIAILIRATKDLVVNCKKCNKEAYKYFMSKNTSYVFSYKSICQELEMDGEVLRKFIFENRTRLKQTYLYDLVTGK